MPDLMMPTDYVALPVDEPDATFKYGDHSEQFGHLFVPDEVVNAPALLLLHGGCWQHAFGLGPMGQLARRLSQLGFTVCNLEYRRIGGGGGWPATFEDVAAGARAFLALARSYGFSADKLSVTGHSAGGHLALWLAGRWRLPTDSSLRHHNDIDPMAVVSLAGIGDLGAALGSGICRGAPEQLMDGLPQVFPERYELASPSALLPLAVPHWHICGIDDALVPLAHVRAFVSAAREAGDRVELVEVANSGHFEIVTATSAVFAQVEAVYAKLMGLQKTS
jgi:acetyl esterase/lipase